MWKTVIDYRSLPKDSGCYAIYCGNAIAYIGHSVNLKGRMYRHLAANVFHNVKFKYLLGATRRHETRLIKRIKPPANVAIENKSCWCNISTGLKRYLEMPFNNIKALWVNTGSAIVCANPEESGRKIRAV